MNSRSDTENQALACISVASRFKLAKLSSSSTAGISNFSNPAGSGSKKKTSPGDVASRSNPNPSAAFTSTPTSHVDISLKLSAKSGFSKSNNSMA